MKMSMQWGNRVVALLLATALLFSAWIVWQNEHIAKQIRQGDFVINSDRALHSMPPLVTAPLRQSLYQQSKKATVDFDVSIRVADEYLARRPLDAQGWLWKSLFEQRSNDLKSAKNSIATAHQLSLRNTPVLLNVFNRYVELGLIDSAMQVAGDLSFAHPNRFREIFYLMSRLNEDYSEVVRHVVPKQVPDVRPGRKPHDKAMYYRWALNDAVYAKNFELAKVVWQAAPEELRRNSDFGLRYLESLASSQRVQSFVEVWSEQFDERLTFGQLPNQVFGDENAACWKIIPVENEAASHSFFASESGDGLTVTFAGQDNLSYSHARCLFVIEPEKQYSLRGMWRGDNITTLSGPYLDFYAPSVSDVYSRLKPEVGSWPWTEFNLGIETSAGAEIVVLRLRRAATEFLDSKVSGSVSIKNLRLVTEASEKNDADLEPVKPRTNAR